MPGYDWPSNSGQLIQMDPSSGKPASPRGYDTVDIRDIVHPPAAGAISPVSFPSPPLEGPAPAPYAHAHNYGRGPTTPTDPTDGYTSYLTEPKLAAERKAKHGRGREASRKRRLAKLARRNAGGVVFRPGFDIVRTSLDVCNYL